MSAAVVVVGPPPHPRRLRPGADRPRVQRTPAGLLDGAALDEPRALEALELHADRVGVAADEAGELLRRRRPAQRGQRAEQTAARWIGEDVVHAIHESTRAA